MLSHWRDGREDVKDKMIYKRCAHRGYTCGELIEKGKAYCPVHELEHRREADREYNKKRPSRSKRGYTRKWYALRALHLRQNPWCISCLKEGKHTEAVELDHIIPHKGDMGLFWDKGNWQGLCVSCHSKKTNMGL